MTNYTKVPNKVLETKIELGLNGARSQMVDLVIRETFGFNRETMPVRLESIAKRLNTQKPNVSRTIKDLERMQVLIVWRDDMGRATKMCLNDPEMWSDKPR